MSGIDVKDICEGDWVKVVVGDGATTEGPARTGRGGGLFVGPSIIRFADGRPTGRKVLEHKPKRMDEPDYGEHVTALSFQLRDDHVRVLRADGREWVHPTSGVFYAWSDLEDPQPVAPF